MASAAQDVTAVLDVKADLQELRQNVLRLFLFLSLGLAFLWLFYRIIFLGDLNPNLSVILAGLIFPSVTSFWLARKHPRLACRWFPLTLLLMLFVYMWHRPNSLVIFFLIPVLLSIDVTCSPKWMAGIGSGAFAGLLLIARLRMGLVSMNYQIALVTATVSGLVAWIGADNLYILLAWAIQSREKAYKSMETLQKRRAELRRMTDMLCRQQEHMHYLNMRLKQAKLTAEEAYKMKRRFAANISHELRTPLNLIVGFSEMMVTAPESYSAEPLPAAYRGDLMAIYRNAQHLSDLIDDVLDLSQIEVGQMPLFKEPADLCEIMREAVGMIQDFIRLRGLKLETTLPEAMPTLEIDKTRICQVVLNLLTNATRFTDEGWIRPSIRLTEHEAIVSVQDTGRGIAPEALDRAFMEFSHFNEDPNREGSGLGLAISKRFVELHGGRMWIESTEESGTTVSFTIPIPNNGKEVGVARLIQVPPRQRSEGKPLVLVLHDDPQILSLLERYVSAYEFLVAEKLDGISEIIHDVQPAAVIVDTNWPNHSQQEISALELPPQTPYIRCPLPSRQRVGLLLGADGYLPKPVMREDLLRALSGLAEPPQTILIVDDNPNVVRLLARMLKADNPSMLVLEAFGGREGLEVARFQHPDLILLDLLMPDLDGYELLREIKNDEAMASTQIIVVSVCAGQVDSGTLTGEVQLAREAGFSLTEVVAALQGVLSAVTRPVAISPASGVEPEGGPPG